MSERKKCESTAALHLRTQSIREVAAVRQSIRRSEEPVCDQPHLQRKWRESDLHDELMELKRGLLECASYEQMAQCLAKCLSGLRCEEMYVFMNTDLELRRSRLMRYRTRLRRISRKDIRKI